MKKILMVLIIMLGIFIPTKIKAVELKDSFYEGEYIQNEYIVKSKDGYTSPEQIKVLKRKSDDRHVYSLELWQQLSSDKILNGYHAYQKGYPNIDNSLWQQLLLIAYYGYGYQNHTDIKWYAITQFMIWQNISPTNEIYFTDTLNGNRITKYEDEMNEINKLIETHYEKPSFASQTFELNYKENFTIADTKNVLNRFGVYDPSILSANIYKNELTVNSRHVIETSIYLINRGKIYKHYPIYYIDDNGQDVLLPGNYNSFYVGVNFVVPKSNITLNMLDIETNNSQGNAKLEGAKFQLLDIEKKVIQEKEIGENNKLTFENVGYGTYYLKQIESGAGYLKNNKLISYKIDEEFETINYYNQVIKNKIIFKKYINNPITGITKKESNAKFSIYNNNQKILTFETDENGYYELELPYGTYVVKQELSTKDNYLVDDFEIKIIDDGNTQSFELYSDVITANMKIVNIDYDSNLPILKKGSIFEIKNIDTEDKIKLETNDLGITNSIILPSGNYEIRQVSVVDGYYLNEEVYSFNINNDTKFNENELGNNIDIKVVNKKKESSVKIDENINQEFITQPLDKISLMKPNNSITSEHIDNIINKNEASDNIIKDIVSPKENTDEVLIEESQEINNDYEEVIEVPNTIVKESILVNINYLFMALGLIFMGIGELNENN